MSQHAYAITVEGVPIAFCESTFPESELSAWDSVLSTITSISEGEVMLDLGARRQIGSGFQWAMRDDTAHTLRALIATRQDPIGWLVESSIPGNTTTIGLVEVNDTAEITNPFYMGAETLEFNGTAAGPPRLANVSRALHGSTAQKFYGSDDDGAGVAIYAQPPRWSGRTVTLWESERDEAGTMGTKVAIATARLEDSPSFLGEGRWGVRGRKPGPVVCPTPDLPRLCQRSNHRASRARRRDRHERRRRAQALERGNRFLGLSDGRSAG